VNIYASSVVLALLASIDVLAQGTLSTVAGGTGFLDNIPATQARISGPQALAVDPQGNAYIGDGSRIRRIDAASGIISTVTAGSGAQNLAFGAGGKLVLTGGSGVLKLDPVSGALTTIAAAGGNSTSPFGFIGGLATDTAGNIFVTNPYNAQIYRIDANSGTVTTIAGVGMLGGGSPAQGDGGPATQAVLIQPSSITVDPSGNVYFVEQYWLRRIDGKSGIITTIAPNRANARSGDGGPYSKAAFVNITALATDSKGNLYVADQFYIRKIDWSSGMVFLIAGSGQQQYSKDGVPALQANLSSMYALAVDRGGNIWIADIGNARVFMIAASTNLIKTIAGTSAKGDGGPALGALINPIGLAADPQSNVYFLDQGIRRVDRATGVITTIVPPTALPSTLGNGVSTLALDANGNFYVSAQVTVQRIDRQTGSVTVVAGNGQGFYGDGGALGDGGPATQAEVTPSGVAIDRSGNLYIADYWNSRIRRVDAKTGTIDTIAGNGQLPFSGVLGPPLQTAIGSPTSIALAPNGEIFWTTIGWVLKVNSAGTVSAVAGNGGCGYSGDGGSALLATLCQPYAITFDETGNLLVSEQICRCVRRVDAQTGLIQTVAGNGGASNDGIPATQAALDPHAIAFSGGALFFVDSPLSSDLRIRTVTPPAPPPLPQPPNITGVVDAVDYRPSFSPGAIISIFGNYLGEQSPSYGQPGTNGLIPSNMGGDQVIVKGTPSPLLYTSAGQINTVMPFSLVPGTADVQVITSAGTARLEALPIRLTSLALFSGLVFNPDGTLNGATNPAPKGATLVLYGTGMGQTNPPLADGSIVQGPPFPMPVARFSASVVNGATQYPATIAYLGPLPGFVAGAVQANIQIPTTVPAGKASLSVNTSSQTTSSQTIYLLSDSPVLSGINPSPVPQSLGQGNSLTLTGQNLLGVTSFQFFLNGQPVNVMVEQFEICSSTSCVVFVNFNGIAGQYSVTVMNPSNQVSNTLTFSVLPNPPPTVTAVNSYPSSGPVLATKGLQFVNVFGTNFPAPLSVNIYYEGTKTATLNSSTLALQVFGPQFLDIDFDFQGKAGQYALQVTGANGSSGLFGFAVIAP
jgi:uncharacterized protein (TIGR03437 family)